MKKHKSRENPTIIEVAIEVRFAQFLGLEDTTKIEKILGAKFRCEKDELVTYSATFNPSGMTLQHDKKGQQRLRFRLNAQVFVHLYPDRLSVHLVGKYPGWLNFQKQIEKFWTELELILPNVQGQQAGIRFINQLEQKTLDQTVGFWLKDSPNYPINILSAKQDYFFRCKWPLKKETSVQIGIAEVEAEDKEFRPLIFDIDVIRQTKQPFKLGSLFFNLIEELHNEVYDIFDSSLTENYENFLDKKQSDSK